MNKKNAVIAVVTPFVILAVCAGIIGGAAIIPAEKFSKIAGIVFSADAQTDPEKIGEIKYVEKEVEAELDDGNKIVYPSFGMQYATLTIKSIDLEAPVFFGSTEDLLQQGVCQFFGSVILGETGNVVLDAHCNTFFLNLDKVKVGDEVVVETSYGKFTYKMKESTLFKETDNALLAPTTDDRLTLYTCYGNLLGPTEDRLAVVCELVEKEFYN
ncbi:MAG: class D sortase [Oscillospiraceae bacterium]|nr:class D sortase [Oscillospiraceae bacterium]